MPYKPFFCLPVHFFLAIFLLLVNFFDLVSARPTQKVCISLIPPPLSILFRLFCSVMCNMAIMIIIMLNGFAFLQSDIIADAGAAAAAAFGRTCLLYDKENPDMFIRIFSIFSLKLNICCFPFFFVSVGYDLANSMSRAICLARDCICTHSHCT